MGFFGYLISLLIIGLVMGGLGRLLVPGPNPIGIWRTIGVGLAGALIGGLLGGLLGLGAISILLELAISAGLVYLISRDSPRNLRAGRRRYLR